MIDWKHCLIVCALLVSIPAQADPYLELGIDSGGDELAATTVGDSISAGGGVKLLIGSINTLEDGSTALRFDAGYLFDSLDAVDGSADSSAILLEGVYLINSGPHTFGIGVSAHLSPEYKQRGGGYPDLDIKFDDTAGLLLEYGYQLSPGFTLGVRYTDLTYKANNIELDASSVGLFISSGF